MAFRNYLEGEDDKPYFNLNSLAHYYDKMAGFAELVENAAKTLNLSKEEIEQRVTAYILQNKTQLDQRLGEWDEKLQQFDGSVTDLLAEWVDDGTLTHIIDTTLIDQKVAPLAALLAETVKVTDTGVLDLNIFNEPTRAAIQGLSEGEVNAVLGIGNVKLENLAFAPLLGSPSKNIFNKNDVEAGFYLNETTGASFELPDFFASKLRPIIPSTTYVSSAKNKYRRVAFFTQDGTYINHTTDFDTFTTPDNARLYKFSSNNSDLSITQIEVGNVATAYEEFGTKVSTKVMNEIREQNNFLPSKFLTLNDAYMAWLNGEKFPIAIAGDSTVDGVGTSGQSEHLTVGVDNLNPSAFPKLLENQLRNATGNNVLRIYNAGHSGMTSVWALNNIVGEWTGSSAYADVKMVGIGYGINDRQQYPNQKMYKAGFKANIESMIKWFYGRNIQPFLITTQSIIESGVRSTQTTSFPLRTSESIESVANEVKRELAEKYDLELIDINHYTHNFLKYSNYSLYQVIPDKLHFGNLGHIYEGGLMFAHIVPNTIKVADKFQLDYANQQIKSAVPSDLTTLPYPLTDTFKILANYEKADATDVKIMDAWVFINSKKLMTLKAYKSVAGSLTYVKVNGVTKNLTSLETTVQTLDLGLYRLEVFSGASTSVDFKGFIIE